MAVMPWHSYLINLKLISSMKSIKSVNQVKTFPVRLHEFKEKLKEIHIVFLGYIYEIERKIKYLLRT